MKKGILNLHIFKFGFIPLIFGVLFLFVFNINFLNLTVFNKVLSISLLVFWYYINSKIIYEFKKFSLINIFFNLYTPILFAFMIEFLNLKYISVISNLFFLSLVNISSSLLVVIFPNLQLNINIINIFSIILLMTVSIISIIINKKSRSN